MEFISSTVGSEVKPPANVAEFTALMCKHTDILIESAEEIDAEGCFQVLFKDIQLESNPKEAEKLVSKVSEAITGKPTSKPELRLRIMANLYNVLPSSGGAKVFITVLLSIIKFAGASRQIAMLQGYFDLLDDLVLKWALSLEEARVLFLEVSNALALHDGFEEKSQLFLIKYLATFGTVNAAPPASAPATAETKRLAAKGVAGALRNPILSFTERHNLLGLAVVASLKEDAEHAELYELLSIFSRGKLADYTRFHAKSKGAVVAKYAAATCAATGLSHDLCVTNMRLLSLCTLATEHKTEIPYAAIAADLDVPLGDVEDWVVRTISANLIEAKMDQLTSTVIITRCTQRVFGPGQWKDLQTKLHEWKSNLRSIIGTLAKTQALQQEGP